jgi:GxxExxY protein
MMKVNELTEQIIGAAIEAHRHKGPGLLESTYELCLQHELGLRGIPSERQLMLPIEYKGLTVPEAYRIDLMVENTVIVELKTVKALEDIHTAQVLTYLQAADKQIGLLINFKSVLLKDGIRRLANNYKES